MRYICGTTLKIQKILSFLRNKKANKDNTWRDCLTNERSCPFDLTFWEADLRSENIRMSFDLLKQCSVCISQEVDAEIVGRSCPAMKHKMGIPNGYHELMSLRIIYKSSWATYCPAHSKLLLFSNTLFSSIPPLRTGVKGVLPIPSTVADSPVLIQDKKCETLAISWSLLLRCTDLGDNFYPVL